MDGESRNKVQQFKEDGYVVLENFLTEEECDKLRSKSRHLMENVLDMDTHPKSVFSTTNQKNDDYFLDSQDKIRFFFEENVFDEKGVLNRPKHLAVNKIGHGLHYIDDDYKMATYHPTIQKFAKEYGMIDPYVIQSMVIFKQPEIGGVVTPHQDGTFLMNSPLNIIGLWIALEDADLENGCLHFIKGSHSRPITRKMIRNPDKNGQVTKFDNPPDKFDEKDFIPVPVKKGSAILIHGQVVHKSELNNSSRSREVYAYHIAESHETEWTKENWKKGTSQDVEVQNQAPAD